MHIPHVPDSGALAYQAELQGVLESQNRYNKLQLPHELHTMDPRSTASKP
jgi:hypothetical protein